MGEKYTSPLSNITCASVYQNVHLSTIICVAIVMMCVQAVVVYTAIVVLYVRIIVIIVQAIDCLSCYW